MNKPNLSGTYLSNDSQRIAEVSRMSSPPLHKQETEVPTKQGAMGTSQIKPSVLYEDDDEEFNKAGDKYYNFDTGYYPTAK